MYYKHKCENKVAFLFKCIEKEVIRLKKDMKTLIPFPTKLDFACVT